MVKDPYNNKVVDTTFDADRKLFETALRAAVKVFPQTAKLPTHRRSEALLEISRAIEKDREKIGKLICREAGKRIAFATGEAVRAVLG